MALKHIICFDASVKDNKVGIGIHNYTDEEDIVEVIEMSDKKNKDNIIGSTDAERMALILTLRYIQKKDLKYVHLFTDNMELYNEGINKSMMRKYNLSHLKVNLFWIPRQFNSVADRLSKGARGCFENPRNSNHNDLSPINQKNENILDPLNPLNIKEVVRSYSLKQRYNLLSSLTSNFLQEKFVNFIKGNDENYHIEPFRTPEDIFYSKLVCSLFLVGENENIDLFVSKLLTKRPKLTNPKIYNFIDSKIKNVVV